MLPTVRIDISMLVSMTVVLEIWQRLFGNTETFARYFKLGLQIIPVLLSVEIFMTIGNILFAKIVALR